MSAPRPDIDGIFLPDKAVCELCGEPMPAGEEMFQFHGYSGPCPKPPMRAPRPEGMSERQLELCRELIETDDEVTRHDDSWPLLPKGAARDLLAEVSRLRADGATLRERVRQLSSPWLCRFERSHFTTDEGRYVGKCDWCGTTSSRDGGNVPDHPDNGCLWPDVHQPARAPKEPTPATKETK